MPNADHLSGCTSTRDSLHAFPITRTCLLDESTQFFQVNAPLSKVWHALHFQLGPLSCTKYLGTHTWTHGAVRCIKLSRNQDAIRIRTPTATVQSLARQSPMGKWLPIVHGHPRVVAFTALHPQHIRQHIHTQTAFPTALRCSVSCVANNGLAKPSQARAISNTMSPRTRQLGMLHCLSQSTHIKMFGPCG